MNQTEPLNIIKMHETEQRNIHETNQHSIDDNESDRSDEPSNSLDLTTGLTFSDWDNFKAWMHRVTYECTKSGSHILQATSDPTKKCNTHSQRTSCPWRVNLTYPKTSNIVKINLFNDVHNHPLTSMIQEIAPRFRKLTQEMLADVEKYVDPISRRLVSLLWISPVQRELYNQYNDVVIVDSTYNTNRFQMILCVVTVIDNNYRTRIVACAIIEDETLDTYQWILGSILTETGVSSQIVFSDSDPSLIRSIKDIFPNAHHLICIFHIDLNLWKKLKGKLGSQFEEFYHKFYVCQNSLCEELFELRWNQLIEQYSTAAKYLSDTLYNTKDSHIHDKVDHSTSLCNLLISITDHVKNNEYRENFEVERNALPTIGMPMLNERFFGKVDAIIKKFLTTVMLGKQKSQMNQSVCYDINQITEWHHLIEMEADNEEISMEIREQEQDTNQILLRSLVSNLPMEAILEVWNVRATGTYGIGHYVILLNDGTHLCTCLLLLNKGLVCRYFFCVGTYSRFTTFHISMIPNRWYLNPNIELNDILQQYSFIPIDSYGSPSLYSSQLS
ncbi:unnamed protein product [Rhizophagus irregularis]|nr:unnamed protein product [Rhizophagus irregularis]